ncbi:glycoside hydrolase family 75 protein [Hamadaea tsunoensis]|uniref:glycoside hydrolase family 75 protein n=1 Tax=Hamadaea tsunoensis TaxID=53368 RepID=UPI00040E9F2E|nr:glycoside hydrolase family 75 protein [Hamadaea tsunoensis]
MLVKRSPRAPRLVTAAVATAGLALSMLLPASPASAAPTRYEAENATISQGAVATNHTGYSGTGFVDGTNIAGSYTQFTVDAATAGSATIAIRYANGTAANRAADIAVNGTTVSAAHAFNGTGSWDTWTTDTITATVNAGSNTIRVTATTADGNANLDYVDFEVASTPPPATEYQAEDAAISQGVVESNHTGFTGTGFVNYDNATGSYVQFAVSAANAGSTNIVLRYANGTTVNRPMTIAVNGVNVATSVAFNSTSTWDTWATATVTATLNAGSNTIRATATTANGGPNLDRINLTAGGGGGGAPTAAQLLAKVSTCNQISNGKYKTDEDVATATVAVCQKTGAVFWKGDMDIDCDGVRTTQCNENTDCCFQADTFCHTSGDSPLNAANLPYVVVPSASSIWDYRNYSIGCGTVVAVIYNNQVEYAVVGDTGPTAIIGESSYKTASDLGINPDPSNGGTDSGVTYIVFQGSQRVSPIENHTNAVTLGQSLASTFLSNN